MNNDMPKQSLFFHILAIVIVIIWGTTFVSTKMLLASGLTPATIFALRFSVAYIILIFISPKKLMCNNVRDELLMASLGLTGGSLYFLTENMSLEYTTATNTSLIVCSCPLFATLLFCISYKQRLTKSQLCGAFFALIGMAIVVLNGQFVLHLSPLGDLLAFAACVCWAIYSVITKLVMSSYSAMFINRKVFFYGLLTIIPWFIAFPSHLPDPASLFQPTVYGNLLFLSLVASLGCYCLWTVCIKKLGVITATNYVYLNPAATVFAAALILNETITPWFVAGTIFVLIGLYLHNKKMQEKN